MKKYVDYFALSRSFGIADSDWKKMSDNSLPVLMLGPDGYTALGFEQPSDSAPVIGVLMGREPGRYDVQWDYLRALAKVKILFLDYENYLLQLNLCDALLLPGGSFETPDWYYSDSKSSQKDDYPCARARAYAECFDFALASGKPVLGICAGMQVICAESGLKLLRSQEYIETPLLHKTDVPVAHHIDLVEGTAFRKMMDDAWRLPVNSRHKELVAPVRVQRELLGLKPDEPLPLEVYAFATDGVPEAVGDMEHGILGVQWHPENWAACGDVMQQRIFDWLIAKAREYKNKR